MDALTKKEFIIIEVNKQDDIEAMDLSKMSHWLKQMRLDPERYHNTLHLIFEGYDQDPKEIYEIKAIRDWVEKLIYTYPDVLYFLEEQLNGLQNILLCLAEFVSIKKMPGAVVSILELNLNTYIQAEIPQVRAEAILIQLTMNPVLNQNPSYLQEASERLMKFCN
ncbi:hypothetical protein V6B14_22505 (plasmid) [Sporosarcina psychrophila]|uniref:hypothetical protein n=1 Tax=Sporosarcina psychrophila TaxID=1476 RepID=UPI0030D2F43B